MTEASDPSHVCVLVVDDDEDARESLREAVEWIGRLVMTAASGVEALDVLRDRRPCLAVVDLMMPGMSGLDVVREMKKRPGLSTTRVVIATSAPDRVPRGMPVIAKPIDLHVLWGCVRRSCRCSAVEPTAPAAPAATQQS